MKIAVIVPTIRLELLHKTFIPKWETLLEKHNADLIIIDDSGKKPKIITRSGKIYGIPVYVNEKIKIPNCIVNKNDGVRNLGLLLAYRLGYDVVISLDDDVVPIGDTIQDHLNILNTNGSITWINTAEDQEMRGLPYNTRKEAPVMVSHGVWEGVPDLDGPTQLVKGIKSRYVFRKMIIPKGALIPFCAMNFAIRREAIPYAYQAPMIDGYNRFADIWGGIELKKTCDQKGWAMATGYAKVFHTRASNVFKNIQNEAKGLEANENYGKYPIHKKFIKMRNNFIKICKKGL